MQASGDAPSALKSILVYVQNDEGAAPRLETALSIARAHSAHVTFLHVTPVEAYMALDSFGSIFVMKDVVEALEDAEKRIRSQIQDKMLTEDVSWDFVTVTGNIVSQIVSHACLADLVIIGRDPHADFAMPSISLLGDLLERSRTPLFVVPDMRPVDPAGGALIAWDGSFEAANAVRSSIGLLAQAREVRVLKIEEDKPRAFPETRLLEYLSRHGIHAELAVDPIGHLRDQQTVSGKMLAYACAIDAAYIVMGGYSHSRAGEFLFGGVTRTMLGNGDVALAISR